MIKRYANTALIYAVTAMVCGVFYREFTKFSAFTGKTTLAVLHTHYFLLGMFFFLALLLLAKNGLLPSGRSTGRALILYQVGLNITGLGLLLRGLTQVWGTELSRGLDASLSGAAGMGHILLSAGLILLLLQIRREAAAA
ncbi:membrane protein [Oscillospiraceae bacterium]|nr:membrane protein [Oscillospiraceae bacterium]